MGDEGEGFGGVDEHRRKSTRDALKASTSDGDEALIAGGAVVADEIGGDDGNVLFSCKFHRSQIQSMNRESREAAGEGDVAEGDIISEIDGDVG